LTQPIIDPDCYYEYSDSGFFQILQHSLSWYSVSFVQCRSLFPGWSDKQNDPAIGVILYYFYGIKLSNWDQKKNHPARETFWIFFRADSITDAIQILRKIFTSSGPVFYEIPSNLVFAIFGIISLVIIDIKREYYNARWSILYSKYPSVRYAGIILIVITILLIGVFDGGQFIYFQF
jgi:hypothetical protein